MRARSAAEERLDLGDPRFGVPLALGNLFSWGLELGIGVLLKPWNGFGFYAEIAHTLLDPSVPALVEETVR